MIDPRLAADTVTALNILMDASWSGTFGEPDDTLAKHMAMTVLNPIVSVIGGGVMTTIGLLSAAGNAIPAAMGSKNSHFSLSMGMALVGVGIPLLATLTPLARALNAGARALKHKSSAVAPEPFKERSSFTPNTSRSSSPEMISAAEPTGQYRRAVKVQPSSEDSASSTPSTPSTRGSGVD